MLFHVTPDHTPQICQIVTGGSNPMAGVIVRADDTGVKVVSVLAQSLSMVCIWCKKRMMLLS